MKNKYIVIAPFAQKLRNGKLNPKNYPYWKELIQILQEYYEIIQIGVTGEPELVSNVKYNLSLSELKTLITESEYWISVDSFLPHLAHHLNKRGVVIWGPSNPDIFGYPKNLNILKDKKYLKPNQFDIWEMHVFNEEAFLPAEVVYKIIKFNLPL